MTVNLNEIEAWLQAFRVELETYFQNKEPKAKFIHDHWSSKLGSGLTGTMDEGETWERASVNFSKISGSSLPLAATERHPEHEGKPYEVMGTSLIIHPRNPYIPITHMNIRIFVVNKEYWWFGGGWDLTPIFPNDQDCQIWHERAKAAVEPFGSDLHPQFKKWCDEYFYLPHRSETRGVGGIFYDDFDTLPFDQGVEYTKSVGRGFLDAYSQIVANNENRSYGERERQFQLYRRGRYVEFNLLYDRGTRFGLAAGGRAKSIFVSMPPEVIWRYECVDEDYEQNLLNYLKPREWV